MSGWKRHLIKISIVAHQTHPIFLKKIEFSIVVVVAFLGRRITGEERGEKKGYEEDWSYECEMRHREDIIRSVKDSEPIKILQESIDSDAVMEDDARRWNPLMEVN